MEKTNQTAGKTATESVGVTETRYVKAEDKEFASCNTPECGCGAEYELWVNGVRKDARCEVCAEEMGWAKFKGAFANEAYENKCFNASEKQWEENVCPAEVLQ